MYTQHRKQKIDKQVQDAIDLAWRRLPAVWPIENFASINPLSGFEDMSISDAIKEGFFFFEQENLPTRMYKINIESIKLFQIFLGKDQAIIKMPNHEYGMYVAISNFIKCDKNIHSGSRDKMEWLNSLPPSSFEVILKCIQYLNITQEDLELFFTLILTTLPGFSAYVKYCDEFDFLKDKNNNSINKIDYLAIRLILTCMLWHKGRLIIDWHRKLRMIHNKDQSNGKSNSKNGSVLMLNKLSLYNRLMALDEASYNEKRYVQFLLSKILKKRVINKRSKYDAQFIFCIDVRSEPFKRAIEEEGNYETYGVAGFFGLPIKVLNEAANKCTAQCPVIVEPKHSIVERVLRKMHNSKMHNSKIHKNESNKFYEKSNRLSYEIVYQFIKDNVGLFVWNICNILLSVSGLLMLMRVFCPILFHKIKTNICSLDMVPNINNIPISEQALYAQNLLNNIGLTKNFSDVVIIVGHHSTSSNNQYASSFYCGGCGAHDGGSNARIMALILNNKNIKNELRKNNIDIPDSTYFIAANYDTLTNKLELYDYLVSKSRKKMLLDNILKLKTDIDNASQMVIRLKVANIRKENGAKNNSKNLYNYAYNYSYNFGYNSQEDGLFNNASFIIGSRNLTKGIDLRRRSFLHSYNWQEDKDGSILSKILTSTVTVARWINLQYFFSSMNNISYGGGSKVTQNIVGNFGIMQGNGSDLMYGLPYELVNIRGKSHKLVRLVVVVNAPLSIVKEVIKDNQILIRKFTNGLAILVCIDPQDMNKSFLMDTDMNWEEIVIY